MNSCKICANCKLVSGNITSKYIMQLLFIVGLDKTIMQGLENCFQFKISYTFPVEILTLSSWSRILELPMGKAKSSTILRVCILQTQQRKIKMNTIVREESMRTSRISRSNSSMKLTMHHKVGEKRCHTANSCIMQGFAEAQIRQLLMQRIMSTIS